MRVSENRFSTSQIDHLSLIRQGIECETSVPGEEKENALIRLNKLMEYEQIRIAYYLIEEWQTTKKSVPKIIKWLNVTLPKE